jgi:hypothetical protein
VHRATDNCTRLIIYSRPAELFVKHVSYWCEGGDSPPRPHGHQILSLDPPVDSEAHQQLASANSAQTGQNPQPRRNPESPSTPSPELDRKGGGEA